ncbi:hypothetical protein ACHAXM_002632, partial [Skeletonema potamos]
MPTNQYATLQIPECAPISEIERRLDNLTEEQRDAYISLSDPLSKAQHDRALADEKLSEPTYYELLEIEKELCNERVVKTSDAVITQAALQAKKAEKKATKGGGARGKQKQAPPSRGSHGHD